MDKRFIKLFEPIKIGNLIIKNRIYMPSMGTRYAGFSGEATYQDVAYFEARARGGAGVVTIDLSAVSPEGGSLRGIWNNSFMAHLVRVVEEIKSRGATASTQLHHSGALAPVEHPVGPSRLRNQGSNLFKAYKEVTPRELSTEEAEELVEKFADAALRAKNCGLDMIEVHGTHGYLIAQFLSPLYNMRSDKYGRDRVLFAADVVRSIKNKCGDDFPVAFRMPADEFVPGGITLDYGKEIARRLEEAGVDILHVTGSNVDTEDYCEPSMYIEDDEGGEFRRFINLGSEIKKVVNIPIISGGLITDPFMAEKLLEEGALDMVFVGRQLIADPDWPNKVKNGKLDDIRPCVACNDGCVHRTFISKPVWCTVNPINGMEYRWPNEEALPKPVNRKKVVIIGAGLGGLEAARICAIRGHFPIIIEQASEIGGTINLTKSMSFKKRWQQLIRWYETQLSKLDVEIRLNTRATLEILKKEAPDAIVVATGSEPIIPTIKGIEKAVIVDDVLLGKKTTGQNVLIIGGGHIGLDVALYLAKKGKKVTIIEVLTEVGTDMETTTQLSFFRKPGGLLHKYGITIMTNSPVIEVKDNGVEIVEQLGKMEFVPGDTVICAAGRKAVASNEFVDNFEEVYVIGDARKPRKIIDAIHEGFTAARDI